MPCVIVKKLSQLEPWVGSVSSQPTYEDTAIPYLDFDKTNAESPQPAAIITTEENNTVVADREIPFYDGEDELLGATGDFAPDVTVPVPDMESALYMYQPAASRVMPPPPPTHALTFDAMLFWHRKLLASPVYNACVQLVNAACPLPMMENDAEAALWVQQCSEWWQALHFVMQKNALGSFVPEYRSWNPYSFDDASKYQRVASSSISSSLSDAAGTRFPVPPPPPYEMVMSLYQQYMSAYDAELAYQQNLIRWWHKACQWSITVSGENSTICTPPTTGATTSDWSLRCECWWAVSTEEMKERGASLAVAPLARPHALPHQAPRKNRRLHSKAPTVVASGPATYSTSKDYLW